MLDGISRPKGPYTVWQNYGADGWAFDDFPDLQAALEAPKYGSNFVIQRPVAYEVTERLTEMVRQMRSDDLR